MRFLNVLAFHISLLFFVIFSAQSLKLYASHQTRGDLTAYAQGMWNTLHGNFLASTYNYSVHNYYDKEFREITAENSNILGIHFNPILLFFVPVYAIFPRPVTLLILQSLLVAGGGWLMYLLSRRILKHEILALAIQFSYLLYFATVSAVLSQFHAYTLALFFAPFLLYFSREKSDLKYYLSLCFFLMVQENVGVVTTFFGLYLLLDSQTRRRGYCTILTSLIYFFIVIHNAIPYFSPYHFYLFSGIYGSTLGGNIQEIIKNALLHPQLLLESIFTPTNLTYIKNLMIGVAPFALISPFMLLVGFSSFAQNILSSSLGLKTQQMHYESGGVAFVFYALILGMSFFLTRTQLGKSRSGAMICLLLLLVTTGISYKKFTSLRLNPSLLTISLYTDRDREMDSLINLIPATASVSTQDYLSAHLSSRTDLYQFPVYADRVDYLLLAKDDGVWPLRMEEQSKYLTELRASNNHEVISETPRFVLFSRSPRPSQSHN